MVAVVAEKGRDMKLLRITDRYGREHFTTRKALDPICKDAGSPLQNLDLAVKLGEQLLTEKTDVELVTTGGQSAI